MWKLSKIKLVKNSPTTKNSYTALKILLLYYWSFIKLIKNKRSHNSEKNIKSCKNRATFKTLRIEKFQKQKLWKLPAKILENQPLTKITRKNLLKTETWAYFFIIKSSTFLKN